MAFPPQFLDELRARVPLVQVIGRRVKLVRKGREHSGLCPFHSEKTPSFTVSEDKGFFHCFGCGAHGDVIGFVMRAESLGFLDAVERLAAEAGIAVPAASPEERQKAERAKSLLDAVEAAARWFEARLWVPDGAAAHRYLRERGLDDATIRRFRLGWAPDDRGALATQLKSEGFTDDQLAEAGLVKRPDDGRPAFVYFRGRVIFPIADRRGRVVAFGGRLLGDGQPKYLNSPDTPLFHKGRLLYSLALARRAAAEAGEVVVVEGYMDVIALAQAGIANAVAPLGTALTESQLLELWRLAPEPILLLDGDAAGARAATRTALLALAMLEPDRSLRIASLPAGQDPDTLVATQGPQGVRAVTAAAQPLAAYLWELERVRRPLDTPERRAGLKSRLLEHTRQIRDAEVQRAYRSEFERRFDEAFGAVWSGRGRGRSRRGAPPRPAADGGFGIGAGPESLRLRIYQAVLAALINHPAILTEVDEDLATVAFPGANLERLRQAMLTAMAHDPDLDSEGLRCHLSGIGFSGLLDTLLSNDVYVHARFARPDYADERAREGVRHFLALLREQDARSENATAERIHAEQMTEASLDELEASQRPIRDSEALTIDLDRYEAMARRKADERR